MTNLLYPVFLKLKNKKILIVGGGFIALQKLIGLLETEAQISILAPTIIDEVYACKGEFPNLRLIKFIERDYQYGDEKDFDIVFAATNIQELNTSIANRCHDQNILVNAVDQPEDCDFYVPSIAADGDLKIAISTNGKAPAVAQKLRKHFERQLPCYNALLERVSEFREKVQAKFSGEQNLKRRMKLVTWFSDRVCSAIIK